MNKYRAAETLFTAEIHIIIFQKYENKLREKMYDVINEISASVKPHKIYSPKVMATNTTTGKYARQPMLTFYLINVNKETIIDITKKSKKVINDFGIEVHRAKSEIQLSEKGIHCITVSGEEYLESHMKIGKIIPSEDRYEQLAKLLIKYGVHLLINYDSTTVAPVTTLRCYDIDYPSFKKINDAVEAELNKNDFHIFKKHLEYGIYDDNVYSDEGWLFKDKDYKNSITEIDANRMLIPANRA